MHKSGVRVSSHPFLQETVSQPQRNEQRQRSISPLGKLCWGADNRRLPKAVLGRRQSEAALLGSSAAFTHQTRRVEKSHCLLRARGRRWLRGGAARPSPLTGRSPGCASRRPAPPPSSSRRRRCQECGSGTENSTLTHNRQCAGAQTSLLFLGMMFLTRPQSQTAFTTEKATIKAHFTLLPVKLHPPVKLARPPCLR